MVSINNSNSINPNPEFDSNSGSIPQSKKNNVTVFAELQDEDGIIQATDVKYNVEGVKSDAIVAWFNNHSGAWTKELKIEIKKLISRFNMQHKAGNMLQNVGNGDGASGRQSRISSKKSFGLNSMQDTQPREIEAEKDLSIYFDKDKIFKGYYDYVKDLATKMENATGKEYLELSVQHDFYLNQLNEYVKELENWQDGYAWDTFSRNGTVFTNISRVTLPNGQPAYKTDQGYFYPDFDGKISIAEVPIEECPQE